MRHKVTFIIGQLLPVARVLGEVDFLHRPEGGDGLLVHLEDGVVPEGSGCARESACCFFCASTNRGATERLT